MDIFIQFQSDEDTEAQGFHAYYEFESQNGTLYKALPGEIQGPGGVVPLDAATGEDIIEHTYGENGMLVASAKKHMQTGEIVRKNTIVKSQTHNIMCDSPTLSLLHHNQSYKKLLNFGLCFEVDFGVNGTIDMMLTKWDLIYSDNGF